MGSGSVEEIIDRINTHSERRDELMKSLERSLAIKKVWPEAFDHGTCKSRIERQPGFYGQRFKAFVITRGDGSQMRITDHNKLPDILKDIAYTDQEKAQIRRREMAKRRYNVPNNPSI